MKLKFLTLFCLAIVGYTQAQDKPNILVIWGDDVGYSNISINNQGMMGYQTPNIDRIASEGVMFRTAWSSAICGPSRALIMTGCYANTTGAYYNGFFKDQKE